MPFIIGFVIWYNLYAKKNPKCCKTVEDKIGLIVFLIVAGNVVLSALPAILSSLIFELLAALLLLCVAVAPIVAIVMLILKALGIVNKPFNHKKDKRNEKEYFNQFKENSYAKDSKRWHQSCTKLTKTVRKRRKIVEKFNDKYDLTLTEEEIDRIVDASYMSYCWEKEIYDMDKHYDSVTQWYNTDTCWLRAYIRVFPVQSISSDFERQRKICLETFQLIFDQVNPVSYNSIEACVDAINTRYFSFFDEVTFMIAHRFLKAAGKEYDLPKSEVFQYESELDALKRKYDEEEKRQKSNQKEKLRI